MVHLWCTIWKHASTLLSHDWVFIETCTVGCNWWVFRRLINCILPKLYYFIFFSPRLSCLFVIDLMRSVNLNLHYTWCVQLSSSNFMGRSGGSSRRAAAVSSSRDAFVASETDPQRSRTAAEASPGAMHRISSGQRSSPVGSSDPKRTSSGRNTAHIKNYETTLKGIEGLHFDSDERVHY